MLDHDDQREFLLTDNGPAYGCRVSYDCGTDNPTRNPSQSEWRKQLRTTISCSSLKVEWELCFTALSNIVVVVVPVVAVVMSQVSKFTDDD